jgi:hypothetical protein
MTGGKPMDDQLWHTIKQTVVQQGFFVGLENLRQQKKLSAEDVGKVRASLFVFLKARIAESRKEIQKIQAVLSRLEATCQEGMIPKPVDLVFSGPVNRVGADVQALDGWVVSLYETDLTIVGVLNPTTRKQQPLNFAQSMERLWQKREQELLGVRDVSLFATAWGS